MRKPRSDSKLANLPEEQLAQLHLWFQRNLPYVEIQALLKSQFHVSVSLSGISAYWCNVGGPVLRDARRRAVALADEIGADAEKHPGRFEAATIDQLKQLAFQLSLNQQANPKDVKAIFSLVLKARDQALDEKQLAFEIDRFQFDASKAALKVLPDLRRIAGDKSLDETAKINAVRQTLFGVTP